MSTIVAAADAAHLLRLVPHLLDYTPTQSLVVIPLRSGRSLGVMRVDLPPDDADLDAVASTVVYFASPTAQELEAYLATGEPLAVAGAFTLDGLGAPFVRRVEGDPAAVVGLSLTVLRTQLGKLGLAITDLWRR